MNAYVFSCKSPKTAEDWALVSDRLKSCAPSSLVCFPEYFLDGEQQYERISFFSSQVDVFQGLASEHSLYLSAGMVQLTSAGKQISGVLFDPSGEFLGSHQKVHVTSFEKKNGILPGEPAVEPINTSFGTVSFSLGKDQWYFNSAIDAEVLLHPRGFGLNDTRFGFFL